MLLETGRFVLTITKYATHEDKNLIAPEKQTTRKKKTLHIKRKNPTFEKTKTIYCFNSFDTFCDFCKFLERSSFKETALIFSITSSLYEYNSNYYLIFTAIDAQYQDLKFISPIISEFAHFVNHAELFERKVLEYGKPIIRKNAIATAMMHFA